MATAPELSARLMCFEATAFGSPPNYVRGHHTMVAAVAGDFNFYDKPKLGLCNPKIEPPLLELCESGVVDASRRKSA